MNRSITPDLKDAHIQDIASVFTDKYTENQMTDILRRFEAEDIAKEAARSRELPRASTKKQKLQNWLRVANGRPVGRKILAYMIEDTQPTGEPRQKLEAAMAGSRFVLHDGQDGLELMLRITATAEVEIKEQRAFVEDRAPEDVLNHIETAKGKLSSGEYEEAMAEAREALSAMAKENYAQALDELCSKNVIKKWDKNGHPKRFDREMLYMPYGYCSTLGAHRDDPNALQAETGIILVEEAVHFLLRTIDEARDRGVTLEQWAV